MLLLPFTRLPFPSFPLKRSPPSSLLLFPLLRHTLFSSHFFHNFTPLTARSLLIFPLLHYLLHLLFFSWTFFPFPKLITLDRILFYLFFLSLSSVSHFHLFTFIHFPPLMSLFDEISPSIFLRLTLLLYFPSFPRHSVLLDAILLSIVRRLSLPLLQLPSHVSSTLIYFPSPALSHPSHCSPSTLLTSSFLNTLRMLFCLPPSSFHPFT